MGEQTRSGGGPLRPCPVPQRPVRAGAGVALPAAGMEAARPSAGAGGCKVGDPEQGEE